MLGSLEQFVLMAVLRQAGNAYGVSIGEELRTRTGKDYSLGSLYTTLERLEAKKYVRSREGAATAERGGRAKRLFEITGLGQAALSESMRSTAAMARGLPALKEATP